MSNQTSWFKAKFKNYFKAHLIGKNTSPPGEAPPDHTEPFPEESKAMSREDALVIGETVSDPEEIGEALLEHVTVLGAFISPDGIPMFHVYKIINHIFFEMVLFGNRDLHALTIQAMDDDYYAHQAPLQILENDSFVFFDLEGVIDVRKAHIPDSPNADQLRHLLLAEEQPDEKGVQS